MANFGISFTDPFQNQNQQQQPGGQPTSSPLQSAVQLLSLRLPRFGGVQTGAMAPGALLQGRGAGGMSPADWLQLLQRLQMAGGTGGGGMTPRVTPGVQPPPQGPAAPGKPMPSPGSGFTGSVNQPVPNDPPGGPWPGNPGPPPSEGLPGSPWPGNPTPPTGLPGTPWPGNPYRMRGPSY